MEWGTEGTPAVDRDRPPAGSRPCTTLKTAHDNDGDNQKLRTIIAARTTYPDGAGCRQRERMRRRAVVAAATTTTTASALCVDVVRVQGEKLCCFPIRTPILHAGDAEK